MEDESSVYKYMCKYVVGTENHIKTIRLMNTFTDNLSSNNIKATITSGSFGEGLQMVGSDLDIMLVNTTVDVHDEIKSIVFNPAQTNFLLMTEDIKAGFAMLRFISSPYTDMQKNCEKFKGSNYLSNALFKKSFLSELCPILHGPCISDKNGNLDFAHCLHSKYWVTSASQWTMRSKNSWPTEITKQMIIKHGVLFVPIGSKGSKNEDLEWRMSFSVGEKFLIYTFSHTQLLCYALMKILLKDVINTDSKCKGLLCSYYLKIIIFWLSEELQPAEWTPANLIPCFVRCFRRLMYCVEYSVCPHYFIPENNLFENTIEGLNRINLINRLRVLFCKGWRCILLSEQFSHFLELLYFPVHTAYDQCFLYHAQMHQLFKSRVFICVACAHCHNFRRAVHYSLAYKTTKLSYMHAYFMSLVCNTHCQSEYVSSITSNKNQYKQYNTCQSYLYININHDTVSGWLMLASFFYKENQYQRSLNIIVYALSKHTHNNLFLGSTVSAMQRLKKYGVVRSFKFVLEDHVIFKSSAFIPIELLIEGNFFAMPPTIYAHFLSFLCHYHLKNTRECQNLLRDLKLTIAEYHFTGKIRSSKSASYYCLGTALQLMGDCVSAKEAFTNTVKLMPHPFFLRTMKRLPPTTPS